MFKFFKKVKKNKKGYTLTELIVVVAILGILAAVATPMILNQVGKAKTSADAANKRSIENAYKIGMAQSTDTTVPSTLSGVQAKVGNIMSAFPTPSNSTQDYYLNPTTGEATATTTAPASNWINLNP
ncbi:hypothetical protein Cpap_0048 [Ruminiclostridium papyrosolvens DSM 2782]|uniref:Uncharacterized protein n=1 Tax=Ruminiclostridium papyrosolvens DSM 2782 TaxID=588581 RepID=F1TIM2_9FIRM|nr:prepilin-type N-terminal cleavage/methylation domain-containing protein [Ruminiclostridium papyrosolvens]EGD45721.1 hypothetical protein Cpap_0048 [Ruminiclostridium papyrosolvens DSM 2782]WES35308.1 prepilin-type N-terminal cleavage/methylation domain-containing protein [Ruminiclostridium papyrosolvens DSM 2782]